MGRVVRSVLRSAVLPLIALVAVLVLLPASPAAAAPTPGLSVNGLQATDGKVNFVLTPQYLSAPFEPTDLQITTGTTKLNYTTAAATSGIAPRAMVIVLDASSSISQDQLAQEVQAAGAIAGDLPADASLGLVAVGPSVNVPVTAGRPEVTAALDGLKPTGSKALVDGVVVARTMLTGLPTGTERRLLIIGPGTDTSPSAGDSSTVGAQLSDANIAADAIVSTSDTPTVTKDLVGSGQVLTATSDDDFTTAATTEGAVFGPALAVSVTVPSQLAGSTGKLTITVQGTNLTITVAVAFGGAKPAPAAATDTSTATASTALSWVPGWLGWLIGLLLFLGLVMAVLTIAWPRNFKHERIRQIANFGPGARAAAAPKPSTDAPVPSVIARTALAATASVVRSGPMEERISRRLERAGMKMRSHEWVLLRVCIIVAVGSLLYAVTGVVGGIIGVLIGYLSTLLYQTVRTDRRTNQFSEQLPDALQLVIGSLKSGFSLPQAFDSLVRESPEPIASEFGRALSEHRLGADISDALERLAQRVQSEDLGWTVMAVRIQREVGGNLAEVLQTTVDTMRERGRLRRHVRSLSAEGRLSAYVLIGLPISLGLFMFIYRRAYMLPLFTDPLGIIMLSIGGLLFILGIFWMTRVIKVEA